MIVDGFQQAIQHGTGAIFTFPVDPVPTTRGVVPVGKTKMTRTTFYAAILMAGTAFLPQLAAAASPVADDNGMTLYTFDNDAGGVPSCYDACAVKWPPYLAKADEKKGEGWTTVDRTDKTKQWAYDGKPMYFFAGDKAKGDTTGDGLGGVWHDIVE